MEYQRLKKKRTHVRFKDRDYEDVKKEAIKLGISIPEYIRVVLKKDIQQGENYETKMDR